MKKLHREDANDKHKSLDFGMDIVDPARGPGPMQEANQPYPNHAKGISLDVGHPYLAPPTLHDSRDSFNSLPQSVTDDGKYRPANSYFGNDSMSIRSHPRMFQDDASSFTGSTSRLALGDDMNQGLLRNAQRMSRSSPPLHENPPIDHNVKTSINHGQGDLGFQLDLPRSVSPLAVPASQHGEQGPGVAMASTALGGDVSQEAGYTVQSQDAHSANVTLSDHRTSHLGPTHDQSQQDSTQSSSSQPPRISLPFSDGGSDYTDNMKSTTMIPDVTVFGADDVPQHEGAQDSGLAPEERTNRQTLALDTRRDTRRFTLGLRPLPPEDPSDNPEQRANRIRSFYKEYFDENKPGRETTYYEDYGPEFYDSIMYDDYYNPMPPPFAEPVGRRAMTPPPRAPPRFQGPPRHMATGSVGGWSGFNSPGPRAFSSASGRLPGARGPRRPAPPPSPLQELPTPHMLRNDDAIMQAADFAPGKNFKDQREGRAGTPLGGLRPFSPMAPVHSPLVSSFDELSAMPSP